MESISQILARELGREQSHIDNVIKLIDEGNTIPFIARYRKELHGAMDDTSLRTLAERLEYLRGLQERRDTVKKSIEEQGKLSTRPRPSPPLRISTARISPSAVRARPSPRRRGLSRLLSLSSSRAAACPSRRSSLKIT